MPIHLSLDSLQSAVPHLPKYTRPTCHIAGTNGKGSVTALISSILRSTSPPITVGRYNSPHLVTVSDSIVINDHPVDAELYASVRAEIEHLDEEHATELSSFELLTLTALQIFERVKVDIAVIEVGMGGRLDATNIIPDEAILVSALTNVDLDHQGILGTTVSEIAKEKVGIARSGRPFVLGPQRYPEVVDVVKTLIKAKGGELVPLLTVSTQENGSGDHLSLHPSSFRPPKLQQVSCSLPSFPQRVVADFPLYGEHQIENLTTALTVVSVLLRHSSSIGKGHIARITPSAISRGISNVRWRGRLSFHTISSPKPLPILVDGAHNPASADALAQYLSHIISLSTDQDINLTYILALSHSPPKMPLQTLSPLLPLCLPDGIRACVKTHVAVLGFSPPEGMPWVKPVPPANLAEAVRELTPEADLWVAGDDLQPQQSLSAAITWAADKITGPGLVVIAGSLYLVADFYRIYQL